MKILSAKQIQVADRVTMEKEPISSLDLMERAGMALFQSLKPYLPNPDQPIFIFCGPGNNGGDGLVIARLLAETGRKSHVFKVVYSPNTSPDFSANLLRLQQFDSIIYRELHPEDAFPELPEGSLVLDCLWGTGLNKPVSGFGESVISRLNNLKVTRISIDLPSGLPADGVAFGPAVQAHFTLSIQLPKLAFFLPENERFVGKWSLVDIQLNREFIESEPSSFFLLNPHEQVFPLYRSRSAFSHKGTFGHALIIAGSYGKMGAATLATKAALRSGAGLVSAHVPKCGYSILQTAAPEAMTKTDVNDHFVSGWTAPDKVTALGIGPGLDSQTITKAALSEFFINPSHPAVVDADALNILAESDLKNHPLPGKLILTPHPGEFDRLTESAPSHYVRLQNLLTFARLWGQVTVLKGKYTAIALPTGKVFFNPTGNPGMATGGSGDVLTGLLAGLLAQGYSTEEAALLGVWLHGLAGDLAIEQNNISMESLTAGDIINHLGAAWKVLEEAAFNPFSSFGMG